MNKDELWICFKAYKFHSQFPIEKGDKLKIIDVSKCDTPFKDPVYFNKIEDSEEIIYVDERETFFNHCNKIY